MLGFAAVNYDLEEYIWKKKNLKCHSMRRLLSLIQRIRREGVGRTTPIFVEIMACQGFALSYAKTAFAKDRPGHGKNSIIS